MPSPPKDRPSGRLSRLLSALRPSRAGPLPVQTGFPTSLADLVVKNHGRLKKQPSPSSKRGKRGAAASTSPSPSPSPSASIPTSPSPSLPPASPPPPAAAVAVSPSDRPRPDLPPAQPRRRGKGGGFGLGLGFLAVSGMVSLALLVIWSKKVVAAVTVASFSLYLLESVRSSSSLHPRRPRPRPALTERRLCLDGRGRVSPIREVDVAETEPSRPSCSDSDRGTDASILLPVEVEESSIGSVLDESSNPKAKAKKSWKKLLAASAKKLHRGRRIKEAGSSGSSFRSEGGRADGATARGGGNAKAADSSGSPFLGQSNRFRRGGRRRCQRVGFFEGLSSQPTRRSRCRCRARRNRCGVGGRPHRGTRGRGRGAGRYPVPCSSSDRHRPRRPGRREAPGPGAHGALRRVP